MFFFVKFHRPQASLKKTIKKKLRSRLFVNKDISMCNKAINNSPKQIILNAFAVFNRNDSFAIMKVGLVNFTYSCFQNGKAIGNIEIKGNYLVISKYHNKTSFSEKDINERTCILLLAEDASLTFFHRAILVSSIPEIATAVLDILNPH